MADTVAKVGNRAVAKISRKSIFSRLRRCNALQDRYDGLWSFLCETMRSLMSPREGRTSGPEKFPSAVKKDFFNTMCQKQKWHPPLFNHLVGAGEQCWWYRDAERTGRFQVDNQLNLRRLLDRQIGRLFALEHPARVDARLAIAVP